MPGSVSASVNTGNDIGQTDTDTLITGWFGKTENRETDVKQNNGEETK